MCQLWGHVHATVEEGWHRALPVQRLWALPQDERHQQAPVQTPEEAGESRSHTWGEEEEEAKRTRPAGDVTGVFQLRLPSRGPDFQNKADFLMLGTLQDLALPREVLQTLSQAVEGAVGHRFWDLCGVGSGKASL